jgi:dihydroflavonol-4-reductase
MKALVTGATGFIGGNLARELWGRGHEVRALVRPGSNCLTIEDTGVERVVGDILDCDSLDRALAGCEAVFHCAAAYTFWSADPCSVWRTNVGGAANVLDRALAAGVSRVVYTSTVSTIGMLRGSQGDESTPLPAGSLHGHYKRSKYEAEKQVMERAERGAPVVVVNPTAPIGPWDVKPTPTGKIVLDFMRRRIPAYLATGLNVVDVADVAEGHILALERGKTGERYILGNQNMTLKELLNRMSQITGIPAPVVRLPYWLVVGAGYLDRAWSQGLRGKEPTIPLEGVLASKKPAYVNCDKAVRELGQPQSPVDGALKKAVEWFTDHGYVNTEKT